MPPFDLHRPAPQAARATHHPHPADPGRDRCLFGPYVTTYAQLIPFSITAAAGAFVAVATRPIAGPFELTEVSAHCTTVQGNLVHLIIAMADTNIAPTDELFTPENALGLSLSTLATAIVGELPLTLLDQHMALRHVHHGGTARLLLGLHNEAGADDTAAGAILVTHLRPALSTNHTPPYA